MVTTPDPKHAKKDNNILAPALQFAAVTAADNTAFTFGLARGLYIGTGGNATIYDADGNAVVFKNLIGGSIIPVRAGGVAATSLTAADIVALY